MVSVIDTTTPKKKRIYDYTFAHVIHNSTYKKYNYIIIEGLKEEGLGASIMNRVNKAASNKKI